MDGIQKSGVKFMIKHGDSVRITLQPGEYNSNFSKIFRNKEGTVSNIQGHPELLRVHILGWSPINVRRDWVTKCVNQKTGKTQ